jgi:hypothetical protein
MSFNNSEQPNLLHGSMSYDKLREKVQDDDNSDENIDVIIKNMDNYSTTQTDMMFNLLANPKKIVPESEQKLFNDFSHHDKSYDDKHYSDKHYSEKHYSDKHYSDKSSDNRKSHDNLDKQSMDDLMKGGNNTYPTPKGGSDGPSYGPGQNIPSQVSSGRYEGFPNEEELLLGKLTMLRKLGELATQHGVILSQNYSMASSYKSMKYEYELHKDIRDKYNGTKWLSNLMCNLCYGVELGNDYFDPFGFKLDGWSQQMEDDKLEYYEVLGEIYEKYFKSGKPVPPEIKLGFMLMSSAGKFHMQKAAVDEIPDLKDAMNNNPELYEQLRRQSQAEKNKLKEQNQKQKTIFEETLNKQHDGVVNKINDLTNLRKQEESYMKGQDISQTHEFQQIQKQQQIFQKQLETQKEQIIQNKITQNELLNKQRHLEALQKQLNLQRSDCRSNYTETTNQQNYAPPNNTQNNTQKTMRQPFIPKSLQNKFANKKQTNTMDDYNNAINMSMGIGAVMVSDKKNTKYNDNVTVDDDIDNIISRGCESSYDTESKSSVKRKVGRPRKNPAKNTIKINT